MDAQSGTDPMKKPPSRKIYVCSPYRVTSVDEADRERELRDNEARVRKACRLLLLCDCMPLAPHAYFSRFLSDDNPDERKRGMELGLQWLAESDELWVFGKRISDGMEAEIAFAKEHNIPVRYMPEPGELARRWYDMLKHELGEDNLSESAQESEEQLPEEGQLPEERQVPEAERETETEREPEAEQASISAQVQETEPEQKTEHAQTTEPSQGTEPAQETEPEQCEVTSPATEAEKDKKSDAVLPKDGEAVKPTVTKDMLTKFVVAKIKQNRANSERISQLVKAYGVSQLSDLPESKYESFMSDLSEL